MAHTHSSTSQHDDAPDELITIRDFVRYAVSRFSEAKLAFGHGSVDAYDEAVYLVLHTLHLPLDRLDPFLDASLTADERDAIMRVLTRRIRDHVPAAYLTGEAWLGEYRFYVDERVIVPRSFIAELLREELAPWVAEPGKIKRVLDLCTGSGCLAIMAALTFPAAKVDAVDLSPEALEVAARNVADYQLQDRVQLIASDLFSAVKGRKYDLILTNPPYVTEAAMQSLPHEYRREPALALASGNDGLDHTRRIVRDAARHLNRKGLLVAEVGFNRRGVETAFPSLPVTWVPTSAGDGVVFVVTREELAAA